ncbi:alpha-glucan family phosphorylase [Candidatus Woesearchaeota archaeon]|nr:alpha-glucan family phosphorylase [Candidatus Woesearchaeota archaeon]
MDRFLKPLMHKEDRVVAYLSMEIGIDRNMPTYSGGLGILAGDTIKAFADLKVPAVAVSLLYDKGYFYQKINENGEQVEQPVEWNKDDFMKPLPELITIKIEGREVKVRAWEYVVTGAKGYTVPIFFLDTNIEQNSEIDRGITSHLYGGDTRYRLCQEIVLGIGGVRILEKLGFSNLNKYHMNEGHASLLAVELLKRFNKEDEVRKHCVFTTHTPVPAGHDRFEVELVKRVLPEFPFHIRNILDQEGKVNMTLLGLHFSRYINGVAKKHGEISRDMFPGYPIDSITNGVHSHTWTSDSFKKLFEKHIPGWSVDSFSLRYALGISKEEIWNAHADAKKKLIDYVNSHHNIGMDYHHFTIGFARRATAYKRPELLFHDIERLKRIAQHAGKIQIIYAGKAHPGDYQGKETIKKIVNLCKHLTSQGIKTVYLENYNMYVAQLMTAGVDIWLNTPMRPHEASGTSGMKACHNGVPSLSVLDGWWLEGHIENVTGWSIGPMPTKDENVDNNADAADMYEKLEKTIVPLYYNNRDRWVGVMRHAISNNASFFNTHRMVHQYVLNAYFH